MRSTPLNPSEKTFKSRLGLKLTALFLATFLSVVAGLLVFDLFSMLTDSQKVEAVTTNPVSVIDPKLESDLAKVLEFKDSQNTADIKNPFADAGGISEKANFATNAPAAPQTNAATISNAGGAATVQNNQSRSSAPQQQNVFSRSIQNSPEATPPQQIVTTKMRLDLRAEKLRLGEDPGPESLAFAIDDLLPVGMVGGGGGKDEVMFYSESACRVVSFPVGTQFYDGWLDAQRPEGVVFGFFDRNRTMRMRGWGRSISAGCSQAVSVNERDASNGGGE